MHTWHLRLLQHAKENGLPLSNRKFRRVSADILQIDTVTFKPKQRRLIMNITVPESAKDIGIPLFSNASTHSSITNLKNNPAAPPDRVAVASGMQANTAA